MKLLYKSTEIHSRIAEVAADITRDYEGKNPLLLGVLKGCTIYMIHLMMQIKTDLEIDFVGFASYGKGTEAGDLRLTKDLDADIHGRDVIIVEDIIDSGQTMRQLVEMLKNRGAASIKITTFVNRLKSRPLDTPTSDYTCFSYDGPEFLVGFGFDLGEKHRNLPDVYTL